VDLHKKLSVNIDYIQNILHLQKLILDGTFRFSKKFSKNWQYPVIWPYRENKNKKNIKKSYAQFNNPKVITPINYN